MGIWKRAHEEGWRKVPDGEGGFTIKRVKPYNRKKGRNVSDYRKRQRRPSTGSNGDGRVSDPTMVARCPATFEFLCVPNSDGSGRSQTATLLIFSEDGLFKACVNDRAENASCFFSAETFQELLAEVERGLATGTAEWRTSKKGSTRK